MSARSADRALGFPAFAPTRRRVGRRSGTWWGRAWLAAVEDTLLAQDLLVAGRRHAWAGQVGSITISPGRIAAPVHDGDPQAPHHAQVLVEQLPDEGWERFLEEGATRAGYVAALLDRDLPYDLVEGAASAGVRLLPGIGDLTPECTCPDGGYGCVHAAALCYQAAWLFDADPLQLLLVRGRGEPDLRADLPRRGVAAGIGGRPPGEAGTPARQAYARPVAPLPAPPPPVTTAPADLPDPVAGAAARARELLEEFHRAGDMRAGAVRDCG